MGNRPLSLTIIAWLLVVSAVFGLFGVFTMGSNPMVQQMLQKSGFSIGVHQAIGLVGCIVAAASAYGIFKGLPWSRVLYVGWSILSLVFSIVAMPIITSIAIGAIFTLVIAFFLFRPAADAWFGTSGLSLQRGA